mmetsp:Transcript_20119/g.54194  ORF Transcript_20119/g.54194 Transcript_20119/m.54194 type:complete len:236 (+) Transcript_20119:374-1081(+)
MGLERSVRKERQVRLEHDCACATVPVLWAAGSSRLRRILLACHLLEVRVIEAEWVLRPWALKAGSVAMAAAHAVRSAEGNNVLVIKTLGVEYGAKVIKALISIGKSALLALDGLGRGLGVLAAKTRGHRWPSHHLNRHIGSQDPQVSVGDRLLLINILLSDRREEAHCDGGEAGVRAKGALTSVRKAHHGVGTPAGLGPYREDPSIVPAQADEDGTAVLGLHKGGEIVHDVLQLH